MSAVDEVTLMRRLQSMLELQDGVNSKIRSDWLGVLLIAEKILSWLTLAAAIAMQ